MKRRGVLRQLSWVLAFSLPAASLWPQEARDYTITTVIGTGQPGYDGNILPALETRVNEAREIAIGLDGSLYFSDEQNARIRRLRPDGLVENIAGTGAPGFSGDGGPAELAQISQARGLTVAPDGTIFFADSWNHRIRTIAPDGVIDTLCGTGTEGFNGDNRVALATQIARPNDVAIGPDGLLYFSDGRNHRIRRINANGRVSTVAGNGSEAYGGDGGPPVAAALNSPSGIAFGPGGTLFIADEDNHRIREIRGGMIRTVVGTGEGALGASDVPPLQARIQSPRDITFGADGTLYLTDSDNHRIGMVRPGGNFIVLAGRGSAGFSGDGGPAWRALLSSPKGVVADSDGNVYVGDTGNHRVRRIAPPSASFRRGDVSGDGTVAMDDIMTVLRGLFTGDAPFGCADAADTDDDGLVNVTDCVRLLGFFFLGGPPPSPPYPDCGRDPTPDDGVSCETPGGC